MSEKEICISARKAIIIAAEEGAYCISFCDTGRSYSYEIDVTTGEVVQFSNEPS